MHSHERIAIVHNWKWMAFLKMKIAIYMFVYNGNKTLAFGNHYKQKGRLVRHMHSCTRPT